MAELRAYNPSLRERIMWGIAGKAGDWFGAGRYAQQDIAKKVGGLIDFVPGVGEAVGLDDAYRDYQDGNYGLAAAGLGLTAAGAVPGVGDAMSNILKRADFDEAIKKAREIYDYVGLRTVPEPIDASNLRSRMWVDGDPTDQFLDGLSVTDVSHPKWPSMHGFGDRDWNTGYYPGDYTYLIGGYDAYRGEDAGERIIRDPVIIMGGRR